MNRYDHYIFDIWSILEKNPTFKERVYSYILGACDYKILDEKESKNVVDLILNQKYKLSNISMIHVPISHILIEIIYLISGNFPKPTVVQALDNKIQKLYLTHLPTLKEGIEDSLQELTKESTLSILSDTQLVKGRTIELALLQLDLKKYFKFSVYSDEIGLSKPNPELFQYSIEKNNCTDRIVYLSCSNKECWSSGIDCINLEENGYLIP